MKGTQINTTICRMCGRYCPIDVHVENGKVIKITGNPGNFVTDGKVCGKGIAAVQLQVSPKRLTHPLKRVGEKGEGEWERISWDESYRIIVDKLVELQETVGPQSLAYHYGAAVQHIWGYARRLMHLFGSPNVVGHSHLCHVPRMLGNLCTYGGMPQSDIGNTKLMILWGYNPVYSSLLHYGRQIIKAWRGGAKLVVIDPIFTPIASKADIYIRPRPGTDGALALGMLNVIIDERLYDKEFVENWTIGFEELSGMVLDYTPINVSKITGVPEDQIIKTARLYGTTHPAIIDEGNGLDQHTNVTQTSRSLSILRSVTGNLGNKGGHIFRPGSGLADITLMDKLRKDVVSITKNPLYTDITGTLSTPHLVDSINTEKPYPIKALIVQGSGAGSINSDSEKTLDAFKKLDLLVVMDLFMSNTAKVADIVLPAASFLESSCLVACPGAGPSPTLKTSFVGMMNKVVEPLEECRSDIDFIFELAEKLGYQSFFKTPEEVFDTELAPQGVTVKDLREKIPGGYITKIPDNQLYETYLKTGFNTPSGKVELYSKKLEDYGYDPLPYFIEPSESPVSEPDTFNEYPLVASTSYHLHLFTHTQYKQLPWLKELYPEATLMINPHDADNLKVSDGEQIYMKSPRGRIKVAARVTMEVSSGEVSLTWGWGEPYASGDRPNLLTDMRERCPISGATGNRSFLCRVEKIGGL